MGQVILGRDQSISLNGSVLAGTREFDVQHDVQELDVTSWDHRERSTLAVCRSRTLRMLIYWPDAYNAVSAAINQHPPVPLTVGITGAGTSKYIPTNVRASYPVDGIVAWDVTLKAYNF